jgi:transcriptional regulator with XRE-family HTH domain
MANKVIYYCHKAMVGGDGLKLAINKKKLKEYMNFKEWDERELAKRMGVDYVTVYRVFKGQRSPGNEFIAKLIKACEGAEFEQLFILENVLPKGDVEKVLPERGGDKDERSES